MVFNVNTPHPQNAESFEAPLVLLISLSGLLVNYSIRNSSLSFCSALKLVCYRVLFSVKFLCGIFNPLNFLTDWSNMSNTYCLNTIIFFYILILTLMMNAQTKSRFCSYASHCQNSSGNLIILTKGVRCKWHRDAPQQYQVKFFTLEISSGIHCLNYESVEWSTSLCWTTCIWSSLVFLSMKAPGTEDGGHGWGSSRGPMGTPPTLSADGAISVTGVWTCGLLADATAWKMHVSDCTDGGRRTHQSRGGWETKQLKQLMKDTKRGNWWRDVTDEEGNSKIKQTVQV